MKLYKLKMLLNLFDEYSNVGIVTKEGMLDIERIEILHVNRTYPTKEQVEMKVLLYAGVEPNDDQNQEG